MFSQTNRKKESIAVDLSAEYFNIALARRGVGRDEIIQLASYRIKDVPEDDIIKMLQKAVKDSQVKDPFVVCCLPLHVAITKNLEIPSLDAEEIREIIDLQAGRQTPYARDEIIVDYISLGTYRQNYTKILLVIVPKNVIKKQTAILEKAGIRYDEICFSPEGVAAFCYDQVKSKVRNDPFGIVHVDSQTTDMLVCHQGHTLFARSIPVGTAHLALDKEKFSERLLAEVNKSLEMYQAEDIDRVFTQLVLTGAPASFADVEPFLRQQTSMNVITLAYRTALPCPAGRPLAHDPGETVSLLGVAGPLAAASQAKISLLPEEIKLKRAFESRTRELVTFSILVVGLFVLASILFVSRVYFKGMYLAQLSAQYAPMRQEAQVLEQAMERLRIIKHYRRTRGYALEVLTAVYEVVPPRIFLGEIKMDAGGTLSLRGTARAMSDVFSFVAAMEEREMFSNVQTNYTTARKQGEDDWADFGITCVLRRREDLAVSLRAGDDR